MVMCLIQKVVYHQPYIKYIYYYNWPCDCVTIKIFFQDVCLACDNEAIGNGHAKSMLLSTITSPHHKSN